MKDFRDNVMDGLAADLRRTRERYDEDGESSRASASQRCVTAGSRNPICSNSALSVTVSVKSKSKWNDGNEDDLGRFFRVALSKTTRKVSYQRNGEFKRYRLAEEDRETHDPNVYRIFESEVEENVGLMKEYSEQVNHDRSTDVYLADSRTAEDIDTDSVDIVVTSPPYGDHGTTVAYGQFSQDPAIVAWGRGYDEMREVDKEGLGGQNRKLEPLDTLEEWSPALERLRSVHTS